ncbi:hypothetical protein EJ04DRAFT_551011 [Polyplosphaeria fusca]|uniref:Uncharacterized protein n=1 Tax=Polyplosphaeria fusca TaxID=682080 RepID=A0A9P4V1X6_9PLEO|nr:hypothetical protein EJ04DRAFT_551011 [Polyplosphaeria fusca]
MFATAKVAAPGVVRIDRGVGRPRGHRAGRVRRGHATASSVTKSRRGGGGEASGSKSWRRVGSAAPGPGQGNEGEGEGEGEGKGNSRQGDAVRGSVVGRGCSCSRGAVSLWMAKCAGEQDSSEEEREESGGRQGRREGNGGLGWGRASRAGWAGLIQPMGMLWLLWLLRLHKGTGPCPRPQTWDGRANGVDHIHHILAGLAPPLRCLCAAALRLSLLTAAALSNTVSRPSTAVCCSAAPARPRAGSKQQERVPGRAPTRCEPSTHYSHPQTADVYLARPLLQQSAHLDPPNLAFAGHRPWQCRDEGHPVGPGHGAHRLQPWPGQRLDNLSTINGPGPKGKSQDAFRGPSADFDPPRTLVVSPSSPSSSARCVVACTSCDGSHPPRPVARWSLPANFHQRNLVGQGTAEMACCTQARTQLLLCERARHRQPRCADGTDGSAPTDAATDGAITRRSVAQIARAISSANNAPSADEANSRAPGASLRVPALKHWAALLQAARSTDHFPALSSRLIRSTRPGSPILAPWSDTVQRPPAFGAICRLRRPPRLPRLIAGAARSSLACASVDVDSPWLRVEKHWAEHQYFQSYHLDRDVHSIQGSARPVRNRVMLPSTLARSRCHHEVRRQEVRG